MENDSSKSTASCDAAVKYGARDKLAHFYSPENCLSTNCESSITSTLFSHKSLRIFNPITIASYSAWLLVHGKSKLKDMTIFTPVGDIITTPTFVVSSVLDPSNFSTHDCSSLCISWSQTRPWLALLCTLMMRHKIGNWMSFHRILRIINQSELC